MWYVHFLQLRHSDDIESTGMSKLHLCKSQLFYNNLSAYGHHQFMALNKKIEALSAEKKVLINKFLTSTKTINFLNS